MKKRISFIGVIIALMVCLALLSNIQLVGAEESRTTDFQTDSMNDLLAGEISLAEYFTMMLQYENVGAYNNWASPTMIKEKYGQLSSYKISSDQKNTSQLVEDDIYFLNNMYYGKYLCNGSSSSPTAKSGLIDALGKQILWRIRPVKGGYVICTKEDMNMCLAVPTNPSSAAVLTMEISDSEVPNNCVWLITVSTSGGCLIKNRYNSRYLYTNGNGVYTDFNLGASGSAGYNSRVWRLASVSYYGNNSNCKRRELSDQTIILNIEGEIKTNAPVSVNTYYNELWTSPNDFSYSFYPSNVASIRNGMVSLLNYGGARVTATHKITGKTKSFYVIIGFSSSIQSTPLADHIIEGLNQPYDVWPASKESRYYKYETLTRGNELRQIREEALITLAGGFVALQPDAAKMLNHYLNRSGKMYKVNFYKILQEWEVAKTFRIRDMNYVMRAVEAAATDSFTTIRTIKPIDCDLHESNNWGHAIGSYTTAITCTFRRIDSENYEMNIIYELHDVYDWDKTKTSEGGLPVSPADMWELHHGGVAKNYEVFGENSFSVKWKKGQSFDNGARISNER